MFNKNILEFNVSEFNTKEEVLNYLSEKFVKEGIVTSGFPDKILERENAFPTGIDFEGVGIAIPHTDPEYVLEEQIGVLTLEKPISFQKMEDSSQETNVSMIFMLALQNPNGHLEILQNLMSLLQNKEDVRTLLSLENNIEDKKKAISILSK